MSVRLESLTKRFGEVIAVKNVNLKIEKDELLVLVGPSGCGKTTILRCIAGLEKPDEGNIYIGERLANDLEPMDRNVAMVFQDYALYPHMTVFKNLAFPLEARKYAKNDIKAKVKEVAEILRISDLLNRKPAQLSGGQKQRVALGRAIIRDPDVFLLDEPLSNLDAKLRVHMRWEIIKLQKRLRVPTLYVTHDQLEAMTMGSRIAVMHDGVILQCDRPQTLYDNPKNLFVAGFLGSPSMNFIECDMVEQKGGLALKASSFTFSLAGKHEGTAINEFVKSKVVLGIRPDDLLLTDDENLAAFKAKVDVIEPLGPRIILGLTIGNEELHGVFSAELTNVLKEGQWVNLIAKRFYVFDAESEELIFIGGK